MHRYFARRPYSVFAELVRHYSDVGDAILDPFCGGGVTLVEGVIQERRVMGFDVNPLAVFITRMELADVDLEALKEAQADVCREFRPLNDRIFATICRRCKQPATALWFEYSALAECHECSNTFSIASANKRASGTWECPYCGTAKRFSPQAETVFKVIDVSYHCASCGHREIAEASAADAEFAHQIESELQDAEHRGLWIPDEAIPDCNMQRESALFKKGITHFRQLFTRRHLLALGLLREKILSQQSAFQDWLLFAFSSTLRYTNRMVTRNPKWRGERPFEWAKPGFWLPAVHLEANVLEEFSRRCDAIWRGKRSYLSQLPAKRPPSIKSAREVLARSSAALHVSTRSATNLPLPDESVDVVITDPPYGSYVHYIDLSNFWAVWLPEIDGLGKTIDNSEEAVIARKKFPGAKTASDYQQLLEQCFSECARVLKEDRYMVLTFHNREPRAWAALLVAATKAGFELPPNGLIYQDGIPSYKHTAQARRAGSAIGDFILSFRKMSRDSVPFVSSRGANNDSLEEMLIRTVDQMLREHGSLTPDALMVLLYIEFLPHLLRRVRAAMIRGSGLTEKLLQDVDSIQLLDSHRRQLLEEHFCYEAGKWSLRLEQ